MRDITAKNAAMMKLAKEYIADNGGEVKRASLKAFLKCGDFVLQQVLSNLGNTVLLYEDFGVVGILKV